MKKKNTFQIAKKCYKEAFGGSHHMPRETNTAPLLKPYQIITDRIITMMENGHVPWRKPWKDTGLPKNLTSGKSYRGINTFMLTATAAMAGFSAPWWMTYRQAQERGGNVKKGEKSTTVVFWKILEKKPGADSDDFESDAPNFRKFPVLKYFHVFNVEQCEGIEYPTPVATEHPFDPIIECERVVQTMPRPPTIRHGEPRAYYRVTDDLLNLPKPELFTSSAEYYCTLFHELTHATGHSSRLNRDSLIKHGAFGSAEYAREELIAEMGAAFLCGRTGIEQTTLENSAAYIQNWLQRLRNDPKLVVLAAAAAQKAADYVTGAEQTREPSHTESTAATIARDGFSR